MKSCLSNGTVGLYDEICKEIVNSIEAVRPIGAAPGSGTINVPQYWRRKPIEVFEVHQSGLMRMIPLVPPFNA
jgi:hypothetical protein